MRKIICKILGCKWIYFFTLSDSYTKRVDVRICRCCGNTQVHKQIISFQKEEEFVWMDMVRLTKIGAEKYWTKLKFKTENF